MIRLQTLFEGTRGEIHYNYSINIEKIFQVHYMNLVIGIMLLRVVSLTVKLEKNLHRTFLLGIKNEKNY